VPSAAADAARRVRRPLRSNGLADELIKRCSIWSTGSGAPLAPTAVPWMTTVLALTAIGRPAVTLATVVWSATPLASVIRMTSPGRMSGVLTFQHVPPGWLTSMTPVASAWKGADRYVWPPRISEKEYVAPGV
jgi:hypothetical protein